MMSKDEVLEINAALEEQIRILETLEDLWKKVPGTEEVRKTNAALEEQIGLLEQRNDLR